MPNVIIYSTPTCPWCHRTKDFLTQHKIKFTDKNVATNVKARDEMVKKSGQLGVPVIDIDGKTVVGFDEAKLRGLLNIK